jgi:hypothetical protein
MANYVSTVGDHLTFLAGMAAARNELGSGGDAGATFLNVNKGTGELTFGQNKTPLPPGLRWVVPLHEMTHGYIICNAANKPTSRQMIPMAKPRPVPPGGKYADFGQEGPRNAAEIQLHGVDEVGIKLTFTAWAVSNANRISNLIGQALNHANTPDGQAGFIHPVVIPKSSSYKHATWGEVFHIDFDVVDWLHADGETLLSKGARKPITSDGAERQEDASLPPDDGLAAPWEDDVTEDELDIFEARRR